MTVALKVVIAACALSFVSMAAYAAYLAHGLGIM